MVRKDYPDVCITCGKVLEDDEIAVKSLQPYKQTLREQERTAEQVSAIDEQGRKPTFDEFIRIGFAGHANAYGSAPHLQCVECSTWTPDGYADLDDYIEKTGFDVDAAESKWDQWRMDWTRDWLRDARLIEPKPCRGCGRPLVVAMTSHKPLSRTCSPRCSAKASRGTIHGLTERACHHCADPFTPKRKDARFCSPKCRAASHRLKARA